MSNPCASVEEAPGSSAAWPEKTVRAKVDVLWSPEKRPSNSKRPKGAIQGLPSRDGLRVLGGRPYVTWRRRFLRRVYPDHPYTYGRVPCVIICDTSKKTGDGITLTFYQTRCHCRHIGFPSSGGALLTTFTRPRSTDWARRGGRNVLRAVGAPCNRLDTGKSEEKGTRVGI